uniref:Uncharacterized protein n=1 Tax=Rhizophora mucronata TaxID=61149 RepID=A0A2P2NLM1_RHIMU
MTLTSKIVKNNFFGRHLWMSLYRFLPPLGGISESIPFLLVFAFGWNA